MLFGWGRVACGGSRAQPTRSAFVPPPGRACGSAAPGCLHPRPAASRSDKLRDFHLIRAIHTDTPHPGNIPARPAIPLSCHRKLCPTGMGCHATPLRMRPIAVEHRRHPATEMRPPTSRKKRGGSADGVEEGKEASNVAEEGHVLHCCHLLRCGHLHRSLHLFDG